jgi:endonuclease/exonuclease/phosphatase family metal-dependent hydrolase
MMIRFLFSIAVALPLLVSCTKKDSRDVDVMTLNIRFDNPLDGVNALPYRAVPLSDFIRDQEPDLLGMQEVLWHQYEYLDSVLTSYGSVAAGRDDGYRKGEACPVFYSLKRFIPAASGTFWLSATPDVPGSVGWGAALTRIATWVRLYDKITSDTLLFVNTHFDHISDSARVMSSDVLLGRVRVLAGANNFVITGDFNALPGSLAIARMKEGDFAIDTYTISVTPPAGERYTFNGWSDAQGEGRIDYIFVRRGMKAMTHHTYKVVEDGIFISDHWPVKASLVY